MTNEKSLAEQLQPIRVLLGKYFNYLLDEDLRVDHAEYDSAVALLNQIIEGCRWRPASEAKEKVLYQVCDSYNGVSVSAIFQETVNEQGESMGKCWLTKLGATYHEVPNVTHIRNYPDMPLPQHPKEGTPE